MDCIRMRDFGVKSVIWRDWIIKIYISSHVTVAMLINLISNIIDDN